MNNIHGNGDVWIPTGTEVPGFVEGKKFTPFSATCISSAPSA
jgi:hypothetical protein